MVHSTAYADSDEKKIVRQKSIQFLEVNNGYAFFKTSMPNLFGKKFKETHATVIEDLIEQSKAFGTAVLVAYTRAMMQRTNKTEVLQSALYPVLFVAGPEDIAAPLTDIQAQATVPIKSYLEVIEGVGHMGMLEAPQIMNQHLSRFIHLIS